jgi:glutaredoxin 3
MLTLYTKNNCGYCLQAKALLKNNNIKFEEINIEENTNAREFVINEGHKTVPQIYHNGQLFVEGGYTGMRDMGPAAIKEKINGIDVVSLGKI